VFIAPILLLYRYICKKASMILRLFKPFIPPRYCCNHKRVAFGICHYYSLPIIFQNRCSADGNSLEINYELNNVV
jgi:hypothetical protein